MIFFSSGLVYRRLTLANSRNFRTIRHSLPTILMLRAYLGLNNSLINLKELLCASLTIGMWIVFLVVGVGIIF